MRSRTQFSDIPEVIISIIFGLVKESQARNRMALVCKKWRELERATRLELCLRGNISNLHFVPSCFQGVTTLDLSQVSPWGYPVLDTSSSHNHLIGQLLKQTFPSVQSITIYARNARNIDMLAQLWPGIRHVKLVRWHQPAADPESLGELLPLLVKCQLLQTLDLSQFYCWSEDVASTLVYAPSVSANLSSLNLLKLSTDGFKAAELVAISEACINLQELYTVCLFDSRYMDCVGDETLVTVAKNCTRIRVLHLVDKTAFGDLRGDPEEEFSGEDAKISRQGLEEMFRSLPSLEDLVLDVSQNVRDSGPALEFLGLQCKKIRAVKLGHFHGVCKGPRPDGIAMCSNLERLCIKNCADLCDVGLEAIATGCCRLGKLDLQGCKQITELGVRFCSSKLRKTLVDVSVSCCKHLDTAATLRALEPIRDRVKKLHIDCIWDKSIIEQASTDHKSGERFEPVGVGSSCSSSNQLLDSIGKQSPKCASWGPSLELGLPDLNHADLDADPVILDTIMENDSLDLNSSLYCDHSGSHPCIYLEHGKHIFMAQDEENVSRYVASDVGDSRAMDVDMNASEIEHNVSSGPDFLSSMGFMDFLGVSKEHQELQMLEEASDERLELTEEECQMWSTTGVSNISTSLENMEFEWPNKRKCINGLIVTEHCAGMCEQKRLCHRMDRRRCSTWTSLNSLSLWMPVGEPLTFLAEMRPEQCPMLEEIKIQVEGDCRLRPKPKEQAFGLSSLACYPSLSKLELDCGEVIGFALSAPAGQMDLSLWERWYLNGLKVLHVSELNYWPPQDKDMNRRGLSLPAAGLLSECVTLRKLFVHGTAHEHFMMMFLRIPNLRDIQLREDYYPAHDNDTSTEMRTESCRRFEEALAFRGFSD